MKISTSKALLFICTAICMNNVCVNSARAEFQTYDYRGNNFVLLEGENGVFTTKDRVTGRFTVDCSVAHVEGTCANLPWDHYFLLGAVRFESIYLTAGPATLPTDDGYADVNRFRFSTDSNGQIVHWDIDLSFNDPSGLINVDTDNKPWGAALDSAAALGGGGVVIDDPGRWKTVGSPGMPFRPVFNERNRTYGSSAGGSHCLHQEFLTRCWDVYATENYDVDGTFEHVEVGIYNYFYRFRPDSGSWTESYRYLSCPTDRTAISAQPNHVTLDVIIDSSTPGCQSYGVRTTSNPVNGYHQEPYEFFGLTVVSGEWRDPMTSGKAVINRRESYYDPWSQTTRDIKQHCNESWGDMMSKGGFSVSGEAPHSQTTHIFEGYDPTGWSSFNVMRCNDGDKLH